MFNVRLVYPNADYWPNRDDHIYRVAGRYSDFSGSGFSERHHGWRVDTFQQAQELKARLDHIQDVTVTIEEV